MSITFTQFMRPNGRRVETSIDRPEEIEQMADALKAKGLRFEVEVLTTGHVSMAIEDKEETIAMRVVPNGPETLKAVDELVIEASKRLKKEGSK